MINLIGRRFTQITAETKKDAMRIALSAKRLSVFTLLDSKHLTG